MYRIYFFSLICLIFNYSCEIQPDISAESARLLQTDRNFAQASITLGSAEAFHNFLADSAMIFPAGSVPVHGLENIYRRMKKNEGAGILSWQPQKADVAAAGDMGWTWGKYFYEYKQNGEIKKQYGKYINIWEKQTDGSWRVVVDIGNASPAP